MPCFLLLLEKEKLNFVNDQEMLTFALKTLTKSADPAELVCSSTATVNRTNLKSLKNSKCSFSFLDLFQVIQKLG